jgi:gliding motility-associated protein GldL
MAKKGNFLTTYKGKVVLGFVYGWGAAIVLIGAWAKILSFSWANAALTVGLLTEAFIFFLSAFEPPHAELEWARVYPELDDDYAGEGSRGGASKSLTKSLDSVLAEANIEHQMLERLGSNLGKLSDSVSKMADLSDVVGATADYSNNARAAANALGEVKDAYASALSSATGLASTLDAMKEISSSTMQVQEQMNSLSENLSSLNKVYGNMLSAMRPQ